MTTNQTPPAPTERTGNCFDALRLALALMVVYNHANVLGGFGSEGFQTLVRGQTTAGTFAVVGFFAISGYLIAGSYERARSIRVYLRHRICRIFPGYYVCQILVAFAFAPAIFFSLRGTLDGFPLWDADGAVRYVLNNAFLLIRQNNIGNVIEGLPSTLSINGPPWTLFAEFVCYLGVIVAGVAGFLRRDRAYLLIVTALAVFLNAMRAGAPGISYPALPTFIALADWWSFPATFLVGSCCWAYRDVITFGRAGCFVFGMITIAALKYGGWLMLAPVVGTLLLLNLGYSFRIHLRHDFSYGIYIYHWPCQQLLACFAFFRSSLPLFLAASLALTLVFAIASWFLVEKPALQWARRDSPRHAA
jgi:peptidoglycan/LPS O-acetylase OafA/YrhL